MNKLKIGFNDDCWERLDFRNLIVDMVRDPEEVEVFLITKNPDTEYINDVATEAGLDSNHVFQVTDNDGIIDILRTREILLYLVANEVLVRDINDTIPLDLVLNNITGCQAILVNMIPDIYKLQPKYVTQLQFWISQIERYTSGETKVC